MKRTADTLIALVGLPIAIPVILLCMTAIRLSSSGPAIFRQTRIGLNAVPFTCYKLRTMYIDTLDAPSHETTSSSVTPAGTWLRRLKLDELPQLWNILRGEMSFVGPRPCLPSQKELIDARLVRGLYAIRPGITGIAQVAGIDMSDPQRLAEVDAEYLGKMSLRTDLQLILATALGAGRGDRVRT
ncbi:sugar transferase [Hyphomicrobium sp. DMF-1]|jgi:O-antigen biosynthesis protein WbqP|uniref:sugar transferase n=1 Tax=Hyphomicrobium sp. DMF-1 TaxID=3019544 RepID=UPI0022EBBF86|nr:sugar transferase [Hyphomicrobium sp. DMF-1]WBT38283.1 sugar transferase [Hyphomicrobium sp. DMF-1]